MLAICRGCDCSVDMLAELAGVLEHYVQLNSERSRLSIDLKGQLSSNRERRHRYPTLMYTWAFVNLLTSSAATVVQLQKPGPLHISRQAHGRRDEVRLRKSTYLGHLGCGVNLAIALTIAQCATPRAFIQGQALSPCGWVIST